jgi:FkbM family methyltransferase
MLKKTFKEVYNLLPFKKQLFTIVKSIYPSIPQKVYRHLHFKDLISVKIDKEHSFKIRHYGFQIENDIFWKGIEKGFEKVSIGLWIKLCKHSDIIFDIGANTGIYALIAKATNPDAAVFAYEPVKRVYEKLNANIQLNNYNIISSDKAVSNNDGKAMFYDIPEDHVYSVTLNKDLNPHLPSIKTEVETIKLSTVIKERKLQKIDLMKIDVETHEPEVLEGMEHYLKLFRPALLIEILEEEIAEKVQKLTEGLGYLYFNIDEDKGVRQVSKLSRSDYFNFLLCNESVAKDLKLINS